MCVGDQMCSKSAVRGPDASLAFHSGVGSRLSLLFPLGNPLEEKHSADGTWRDEVSKRLPKLKKLDGECLDSLDHDTSTSL